MQINHVALILDGNRRYAQKIGLQKHEGHSHGVEPLRKIINHLDKLNVKETTLYVFSNENFNRSQKEINSLFTLFLKHFSEVISDEEVQKNEIKVNFIGRLYLFPKDIQQKVHQLTELGKNYTRRTINFAFGYGGRQEIVDAAKQIAEQVVAGSLSPEDIDEDVLSHNLYVQSEPQIIIRTGGKRRTSNFLLWQSAYSEWFFLDKLWPEITTEDIDEIISQYKSIERNFGK